MGCSHDISLGSSVRLRLCDRIYLEFDPMCRRFALSRSVENFKGGSSPSRLMLDERHGQRQRPRASLTREAKHANADGVVNVFGSCEREGIHLPVLRHAGGYVILGGGESTRSDVGLWAARLCNKIWWSVVKRRGKAKVRDWVQVASSSEGED